MSESTVGTKIGNCERWRRWALALSGRGAVSRNRAPLTLEWMRQFGIRRSRLRLVWGGSLSQRFQTHLSMPLHFQLGWVFARAVYGDTRAATYVEGSAPVGQAAESAERYAREEKASVQSAAVCSGEFLRVALERTRRVEHRVVMRELVLARAPGGPSNATVGDSGRAPAHWIGESPGVPAHNRTLTAPAVNVEQIADTVMRQLDRRIVSWRERMGRL